MANSIKDFFARHQAEVGQKQVPDMVLGLAGVVLLLLPNFFAPRQT